MYVTKQLQGLLQHANMYVMYVRYKTTSRFTSAANMYVMYVRYKTTSRFTSARKYMYVMYVRYKTTYIYIYIILLIFIFARRCSPSEKQPINLFTQF